MRESFSSERFREALSEFSQLERHLQPFIIECEGFKMTWIIGILEELYEYLHYPKISINLAFNSLFALKAFLDTGNVLLIALIEIYLLPKITKIAAFDLRGVSQRRAFSYFIDQGFQGKKTELEYFGHNFNRIASQLIIAASIIKPKMLLQNEETEEPSDFEVAFRNLKQKGFQPYSATKFYEGRDIQNVREKYAHNLRRYVSACEICGTFYASIVRSFLSNTTEPLVIRDELHPNKLFKAGQLTVCKRVLRECFGSLQSPNLNERKRALMVINDFVKWGDVLVAYAVNELRVTDDIIWEISDPHERATGSSRAGILLQKYSNTADEKLGYYNQLLKSIQFWALCFPYSLTSPNELSEIKRAFTMLEQKLDIEFPEFKVNINENYAIFQYYDRLKRVRNNLLVSVFREAFNQSQGDEYMVPSMFNKKMAISKKMSIVEQEQTYEDLFGTFAKISSFQSFKGELFKIRKIIQDLAMEQRIVKQYSGFLREFVNEFDAKIIKGKFNEAELDYLISEGAPLVEKVEDMMPAIEKYNKGDLTYPQLKGYLSEYHESYHLDAIEEIKLRKKETALIGMGIGTGTGIKKEKTMTENYPNLVLPYTESQDRMDQSFAFRNIQSLHKIETNARDLLNIDQDDMMTSNKIDDLVKIDHIKHLESKPEEYTDLPRMTSLEAKMMNQRDEDYYTDSLYSKMDPSRNYRISIPSNIPSQSQPINNDDSFLNSNPPSNIYINKTGMSKPPSLRLNESPSLSSNSSHISKTTSNRASIDLRNSPPGTLNRNPSNQNNSSQSNSLHNSPPIQMRTKTNFQVLQKYGEGVLKISEMREEDLEYSNNIAQSNLVFGSLEKKQSCASSDMMYRLDKFERLSSKNAENGESRASRNVESRGSRNRVEKRSTENGRQFLKIMKSPELDKQQSQDNYNLPKELLIKTSSQTFGEPDTPTFPQNQAYFSSALNLGNSSREQKQQKQTKVTPPPNAVHSHRKTSSLGNLNSNLTQYNNYKEQGLGSEPESPSKRQTILQSLSARRLKTEKDVSTKQYDMNGDPRLTTKESSGKRGTTPAKCYYAMGKQVCVQRGFYKQKRWLSPPIKEITEVPSKHNTNNNF